MAQNDSSEQRYLARFKQLAGVTTLALLFMSLASCSLIRDLFGSMDQMRVPSAAQATFYEVNSMRCPAFPGELDTAATAPEFSGAGRLAIGRSGPFEVGRGQVIYSYQGAARFDLSRLPVGATLAGATLVLNVTASERSRRNSRCDKPLPIRLSVATENWGTRSDFRGFVADDGRSFACRNVTDTGASPGSWEYECPVNPAVQPWLEDPSVNPNLGFVVTSSSEGILNACETNIGEPGNRYDCAAGMTAVLSLTYSE